MLLLVLIYTYQRQVTKNLLYGNDKKFSKLFISKNICIHSLTSIENIFLEEEQVTERYMQKSALYFV